MRLVEAVRRANAPRPAESSVRLRLAAAAAVLVSLAAPPAQGEMGRPFSWLCMILVLVGMTLSHRNRRHPGAWVKLAVAAGAVSSLLWFLQQVRTTTVTDITGVEDPLTVLLALLLVLHSFHVPARRDLLFALAASATLMAVAAAQAIDLGFGVYVGVWGLAALWFLLEQWAASSGRALRPAGVGGAAAGVLAAAGAALLALPAPTVAIRADFHASAAGTVPVPAAGALAGDTGRSVQLSRPGSPSGPTRVGGYLGFAGSLDTALRGRLGSTVIMRVRASRPTFWLGETFDSWNGQDWSSTSTGEVTLDGGAPFEIPRISVPATAAGDPHAPAGGDLQTFYVENATADLVFHAEGARQVWFPSPKLYLRRDGTIVSPVGIGPGAVYTVASAVTSPTPAQLQHSSSPDPAVLAASPALLPYLQLPHPYPQVEALARAVTAGATDEYDQVEALISWISTHTRYSTDIPPLAPGADTVEQFLFDTRTGFCEQISTALAVMLRSLDIPTREAVGYVPGPYNPVTDLYEVRAEDAHAWVQVWFPGFGWQSFDPTASVPAANPSPGSVALSDAGRYLRSLPWNRLGLPSGAVLIGALGIVAARRRRRRHPATPAAAAALAMERAGRRAGRPRRAEETLSEYATAMDRLGQAAPRFWTDAASAIEAAAYGGIPLPGGLLDSLRAASRRNRSRRDS